MKKIVLRVLLGLFIPLVILFSAILILRFGFGWYIWPFTNSSDLYDDTVTIVTQEHPTQIVLCGKDIRFPKKVPFSSCEDPSTLSLSKDNTKEFHLLILNDLDGSLSLDEQTWELIGDAVENDWFVFYLGDTQLEGFVKRGYCAEDGLTEDDMSLCIMQSPDGSYWLRGLWTKQDNAAIDANPDLLWSTVLDVFSIAGIREFYR